MEIQQPSAKHQRGFISDVVLVIALIFLPIYLRNKFHEWGNLSNPLSAALAFLLPTTLVFVVLGTGSISKRTAAILTISTTVALYVGFRMLQL